MIQPVENIGFARTVTTPEEVLHTVALREARPEMADMRTVIIIGSSRTRRVGGWLYTPRSVP